jgi:hypothetical protein
MLVAVERHRLAARFRIDYNITVSFESEFGLATPCIDSRVVDGSGVMAGSLLAWKCQLLTLRDRLGGCFHPIQTATSQRQLAEK